jgi:hypothetical protein
LLAVATATCGEPPAAAPPPKAAEAVDLSPEAWEAAAKKVEWNAEQRTIRCLGTDTTVEVPPALSARVETWAEGDVAIRPERAEDGVLFVRAKADVFELEDFAHDLVGALQSLEKHPPKEATLKLEINEHGTMTGELTTVSETLAAVDSAFRFRLAVVQRSKRSCRIFALAPTPRDPAKDPPMLRLAASVQGSSLDEIAGRFAFRTLGQVLGLIPNR